MRFVATTRFTLIAPRGRAPSRTFLSNLWKSQRKAQSPQRAAPGSQKLSPGDALCYPLSLSPFPDLQQRAEAIMMMAPCPVCVEKDNKRRPVKFECPECGWPSHCRDEHHTLDANHDKYCSRLREANEDEHDLRSGRRFYEFELPGAPDTEQALSFMNWDLFWYTRKFPSIDTERSRRITSKVLSYPLTIANVLHQHSSFNLRNMRLTPEGLRSMTALRSNLHLPTGSPEEVVGGGNKEKIRVFILGARAESFLPFGVWEQLAVVFPSATFHIYFIGPQIALPELVSLPITPSEDMQTIIDSPSMTGRKQWRPPTPPPVKFHARTRDVSQHYGLPAFTTPFSAMMAFTGIRGLYQDVHEIFAPFDPYTDVFFNFAPGYGFPSPSSPELLQIASPADWGIVVPQLLDTKCAIFHTGFSPADLERDIRSLDGVEGVSGEFDWILTPGDNPFRSEKWEVNDFDPRVLIKPNWGIWGIRGKRREIQERFVFTL